MTAFLNGVALGLGLIVAIGAQNLWVLNQSMAAAQQPRHRLVIALTCIGCDATLILLGVFGAASLQQWVPQLTPALTLAGVLFLVYLAVQAAARAWRGSSGLQVGRAELAGIRPTLCAALAVSLLNPHVYLDTVVLLGSVGALQSQPQWFAAGAICASVLWFGSLTALAPQLRQLLRSPRQWRWFDGIVALLMLALALQLSASLPAAIAN